jgi:hypothetical protein
MTRPARSAAPEPPPGNELQAFLWVLAGLIALLELTWWLFDRMYAA